MVLTDGALRGGEEEVGGLREAVSSCQTSRGNERGEAQYIISPSCLHSALFSAWSRVFLLFSRFFPPVGLFVCPLHTRTPHANPSVEGFRGE